MRKKIISGLLIIIIILLAFDWYISFRKVNIEASIEPDIYNIGDEINTGDITLKVKNFFLYEPEIFYSEYPVDKDSMESKPLIVELEVKNTSNKNINLSDALANIGLGVESVHWSSSIDPFSTANINTYHKDYIEPDEIILFKANTSISRICFSKRGWENVYNDDYYYTFSLYPESVKVYLGKPEVIK